LYLWGGGGGGVGNRRLNLRGSEHVKALKIFSKKIKSGLKK
jgi:hypothetical protein